MIPKIIHYCWFGGNPLPEDVKKCIESWKTYCPDYEIRQWNESNFDVTENLYCYEAYKAKKWAFVSDYARLKVLYEYGGIYMDTDVEVIKSLDRLLCYCAFSGFESLKTISTGIMGSERGNEWIAYLLNDYGDKHFMKKDGVYDLTTNVVRITNLTEVKYRIHLNNTKQIFGKDKNMILFPFDYLCAKSYETGEIQQTENTLTIHHFSGSWLSIDEKQYLVKVQTYQKHYSRYFKHKIGRIIIKIIAAYQVGGISMVFHKIQGKI